MVHDAIGDPGVPSLQRNVMFRKSCWHVWQQIPLEAIPLQRGDARYHRLHHLPAGMAIQGTFGRWGDSILDGNLLS